MQANMEVTKSLEKDRGKSFVKQSLPNNRISFATLEMNISCRIYFNFSCKIEMQVRYKKTTPCQLTIC